MSTWLNAHPQARTALRVFVYTFLAVFGLTLFDFLNDVREWAEGNDLPFPDISVLAKAAAAAVSAAVSAALAVIWNKLPVSKTAQYAPAEIEQ